MFRSDSTQAFVNANYLLVVLLLFALVSGLAPEGLMSSSSISIGLGAFSSPLEEANAISN